MIPRGRIPRAILVLAVLGSLTATPIASAHGPDPVLGSSWWAQDRELTFRWRTGSAPPADIKTAIRAAALDITQTKASRAATFVYDADGANPIGYGAGATCGVNGIACFTRDVPDGFTMWLREHGRVFDWGVLKWCQMYDSPPNGCYDAETIALDEFGHIEGLAHHVNYADARDYEDAVVQTLSRTRPKDGYNIHVLGRCDIATLQREYDLPDTSTKYSTCLDIDTVLTLSATPRTVAYGGTSTFTAVLKVADNAAYDRLRNNAVSYRTVKLQRRPLGGTTWTTILTMAATGSAGTYTASVRLTSAAEFRALFSTPSTEGLDGDGSSVIAIAVGSCTIAPCPLALEQ